MMAEDTQTPQLGETPESRPLQVDRRLLEILVCPVTRGPLIYDAQRQELVSKAANLAFPIHNGIPVMLVDEARMLGD